jgi:DNA primase
MIDPHNGPSRPPISLLEYLQQHGWKIVHDAGREEVAGLYPLHRDTRPSFYVNRRKQVFYCHGGGRGGGLARLIRWLKPAEASTPDLPAAAQLLEHAYGFYQRQLARSGEAHAYLTMRGIYDPAVVERMRIGYAPGACLRGYLLKVSLVSRPGMRKKGARSPRLRK